MDPRHHRCEQRRRRVLELRGRHRRCPDGGELDLVRHPHRGRRDVCALLPRPRPPSEHACDRRGYGLRVGCEHDAGGIVLGAGPDVKRLALCAPLLVALLGAAAPSPNPLTFWWYATAPERQDAARVTLECALGRIRAATCLPVDVSLDAAHWVRIRSVEEMPGVYGHLGGIWASTRIQLRED